MKSLSCHMRVACAFLLALFMWVPATSAWPQDSPVFSQQELDQMLAPVALYPDGLLSQILMAASYPLEVVEAQRWTLANPSVTGNAAVQAVPATRLAIRGRLAPTARATMAVAPTPMAAAVRNANH